MHQNSTIPILTDTKLQNVKALRYARKIVDGRGLYLLVVPNGGRYWRYNYRFNGKQKTLALGIYPDVSLANARARHEVARRQLAAGFDTAAQRRSLRSRKALYNDTLRI